MANKHNENNEKMKAALQSVVASAGLTIGKLVIGLMTNSLGILAEAAHSGLDLLAAGVTSVAVHFSGQAPDEEHPYGHGKVENLSALFETLLLIGTAVWIIIEAIQRLFFHPEVVRGSAWSFVMMAVSIVVDINRSRNLYRVAEKYNSQALEADALHFQTDIWSSVVVLVGLVGIKAAESLPGLGWLAQADSVAALVVAVIVLYVSGELGLKAVNALLDKSPDGIAAKITERVMDMQGISDCHRVRVRSMGPEWLVDLHIRLEDENMSLVRCHDLCNQVEVMVRDLMGNADVTVHPEP